MAAFAAAAVSHKVAPRRIEAPQGHAKEADIKVQVRTPQEALASFQIQPGLEISLAASEPMVAAPVTAAFDEMGRMWVVEMQTYMNDIEGTGELEPRNRVLILEDMDHDGVMDRSTVFLDNLVLPRGIAPAYGGVLIIEPPNLLFCKDTDGDGKADVRQVLLDGFAGRESPEHAGNGPIYGIDGWWEFAQHSVRVKFDGVSVKTEKTPVLGQWGVTRDDGGRLYYTPNSNPLLVDLFPKQYAGRESSAGTPEGLGESIGRDGTTWPAIPTPTVNRGYREGTLRADGTLGSVTAACAPIFLRSDGLGAEYRGNVLMCEPAGQLVKRLVLRETGDSLDAVNIYRGTEFLRSTDERFRPVNTVLGPDGALYILDMYRGLIQHRMFLTPHLKEITRSRGMETPVTCGRIWRISSDQPRQGDSSTYKLPGLRSNAELVELLGSKLGYERDTAHRLLIERNAVDVESALRTQAFSASDAPVRVESLWVLEGLKRLTGEDIARAWKDAAPELRVAALRMQDAARNLAGLGVMVGEGVRDPDPRVRVQAALSLGTLGAEARVAASIEVYRTLPGERLVRSALKTSVGKQQIDVLRMLLAQEGWPESAASKGVLRELADGVLSSGASGRSQLARLCAGLVTAGDARGEMLVERFSSRLKLDSDEPAPMSLAEEPKEWLAAAESNARGATQMRRCSQLFEWKGHQVARVARRVRDLTSAEWDLFNQGKKLFAATCAQCHQQEGQGSPGVAPPLAGSPLASGPGGRMVRVVLHGLEGGYMPGGGSWGVMPPPAIREPGQIAAILTYVRRSWGNTGDPVTPAAVAKIRQQTKDRAKPWTRDELNGVKE